MDIIKVCEYCRGDGFTRVEPAKLHPYTNVAHAIAMYSDGSRSHVVDGPYLRKGPAALYEFKCSRCDGAGEITWRRGGCITPICP